MSVILWDKPVAVRGHLVFGPTEALIILHTELGDRTDLHHKLACKIMSESIAGRISPDEARECFEAVLEESEKTSDINSDNRLALAG